MTYSGCGMRLYLRVGNIDELEEQYEANEHRLSMDKAKARVEITLIHKETKHEQREEEVDLK